MIAKNSRLSRDTLQEQIRESVQTGRITAIEESAIRDVIDLRGNEIGLQIFQYFEKMNSIKEYLESNGTCFKMHEFYYGPNMPEAEKQKIALALKEALRVMEFNPKREGRR